jgi:hypothetical protein
MDWLLQKLDIALLTPLRSIKKRYIPLLLIYFAYGASAISSVALTFWEKEGLSLSAEQLTAISVWAFMPWTLKMVFGQLVDHLPILGNKRQSYIYIGVFFVALGAVLLAGLAGQHDWIMWVGNEYWIYLMSSVFTAAGFVIQDVTADTMTTEVVDRTELKNGKISLRDEKSVQADLAMVQVLGRLALSLAGFAVAGIGGYMAKNMAYETVFWVTLVLPLIACGGAFFVRLDNTDSADESANNTFDYKILSGGIGFAVFTIFMAMNDIAYSQEIVFGVSAVLLTFMFQWVTQSLDPDKKKMLVSVIMALFLYRLIPTIGPGIQWWVIDELGFDQTFFGWLGQVGSLTALLVLWFFSDFITKRPVRQILLFLVVMDAIIALPELFVYYGFHETLGLSAKTVFLFDTAIEDPLVNISMIPVLATIAYFAPAGNRGTWFAIGASIMNLAITGKRLITKYGNQIFEVTREVKDEAGNIITAADYSELGYIMWFKMAFIVVIPTIGLVVLYWNDRYGAVKK